MNNDGKLLRMMVIANLVTILVILLMIMTYQVRSILPPILTAMLVAYLFYPVVSWGHRIGIPRLITTTVLVLLLISSTVLIAFSFMPAIRQQIRVLAAKAEEVRQNQEEKALQTSPVEEGTVFDLDSTLDELPVEQPETSEELTPAPEAASAGSMRNKWKSAMDRLSLLGWPTITKEDVISKVSTYVMDESVGVVKRMTGLAVEWGRFLMIFFFVLIFALLDGHRLHRATVSLLPNEFYESGLFVLHKTEKILGDYLRGLFVENILLGIIAFILLFPICLVSELKILLVLVIALIFAVTNAVRIIGPIIGGAIGMFLVLTYTGELAPTIAVMVVAIVVQLLDTTVLLPLVMQDQVNLHPVVCLVGIIMGGLLGGVLGMILAIPVISGIKVIYRVVSVELKRLVEPAQHSGDYTLE